MFNNPIIRQGSHYYTYMACSGSKVKKVLRSNLLSILTVAGVVIGIAGGVGIRKNHEPESHHDLIKGIRC